MDSSSLRKWRVLSHRTDEELGNMAYLHIYGGCDRSTEQGLSALFVTHDDEVYGTGVNNLIGSDTKFLHFNEAEEDSLGKCVKVDALSGLGINKIVVGTTIGAALTNNGDVYVWGYIGGPVMVKVEDEDIAMYETYGVNMCKFCFTVFYSEELIGWTSISRCPGPTCNKYPTYTMNSPPPSGTAVGRFVKFRYPVECPKCGNFTSSKKLNGCGFHFCAKCNMMLEVTSDKSSLVLFKNNLQAPQKLEVSATLKISDIYGGSTFFVMKTVSNWLVLSGSMCGTVYKGCVFNPDNVHIKSVSCGGNHLAVISSSGELYTCGLGDKGQLGYEWTDDMGHMTLRKVPLNGSVLKVCCGYTSTACLMSNGSIMCFGSNMKKLSSGIISLSTSSSEFIDAPTNIMEYVRFVDIAHAPLTNVFCAKTDDSMVLTWGKCEGPHHELLFAVSELAEALTDLPCTYVNASHSREQEQNLLHFPICQEFETLFGKELFSDFTLKLADGDFPVHRVVLLLNSSYFKDLLSNKKYSSDVLDTSFYNPTSYKCLLKYFYQLPLEDLNCEDLFDLYSIATSYREKDLADATFNKLKAMINENTVLKLVSKAKSTNAEELLKACELFLSSPESSFVSQDIPNEDRGVACWLLRVRQGIKSIANNMNYINMGLREYFLYIILFLSVQIFRIGTLKVKVLSLLVSCLFLMVLLYVVGMYFPACYSEHEGYDSTSES